MQANGGTSTEVSSTEIGTGNEQQLSDMTSISPATAQTNTGTSIVQAQPTQPQQQQQIRTPSSPSQQQQHPSHLQQPVLTGSMTNSSPGGAIAPSNPANEANVHHQMSGGGGGGGGGGHRQRHGGQSYHNQHYHHNKQYNNPRGDSESNVNHVLLITVINPHYPITCDLIHQICSTYGKVNRIVIFKKNGVQAMVEFDNVESAKRAKTMLYGCDIYSGCCTLRIEYAKPTRLNIHKNDNESFDYTNPNLGNGSEAGSNPNENLQGSPAPHSTYHGIDGGGGNNNNSNNQQPVHRGRGVGGAGGNRRGGNGGGTGSNGGGGGGHHQNHHHHQFHPSQQHIHQPNNVKPPIQSASASGGAYGMGSPMDQGSGPTGDPFNQDAGFNVPRGGPPSNYVGVDPFLPAHSAPHGIHGNMYQRQDGHHTQNQHHQPHHHHHHHPRNPLGSGSASGGGGGGGGASGGGGGGGGGPNHSSSFSSANPSNALMAGPSNLAPQGNVMMVYGLHPERVNCDRLFNLFCLYGNVVRVKFLRTKEGCAMVQMGDVLAVDRCVSSLNKITLFGNELQISYSKQAFLHDVIQPFILPDGSPSFKDFMGNKNNRFKNPEVASKNRILPPSQVLHFFNAPFGITEDELVHLFKQTAGHEPVSLKIFTPKDTTKSFSGLVTFRDPAEATEALVLCNHLSMPKAGAPHPYILRLCFSPPAYMRSCN